jgi:hypothetical protein
MLLFLLFATRQWTIDQVGVSLSSLIVTDREHSQRVVSKGRKVNKSSDCSCGLMGSGSLTLVGIDYKSVLCRDWRFDLLPSQGQFRKRYIVGVCRPDNVRDSTASEFVLPYLVRLLFCECRCATVLTSVWIVPMWSARTIAVKLVDAIGIVAKCNSCCARIVTTAKARGCRHKV